MEIEQTFKRATRNNAYRRFMIEDGLKVWYVHMNFDNITWIRERLWNSKKDDVVYEKTISELPVEVMNEFKKFLEK